MELQAGDHPIAVTFFQAGAGFELSVEWEGPGDQAGGHPERHAVPRRRSADDPDGQ